MLPRVHVAYAIPRGAARFLHVQLLYIFNLARVKSAIFVGFAYAIKSTRDFLLINTFKYDEIR
jgi:hypothetical protein